MTDPVEYGFRHDPMEWVRKDRSLQAAAVRTLVLDRPGPGDRQLLEAQVQEILSQQAPDGSFGSTAKATGAGLLALLEHGADPDRPQVQRAADAVLRQTRAGQIVGEWYERGGKVLCIYALRALCLLGRKKEPEVRSSLKWLVKHADTWNGPMEGCPWTPAVFWSALWAGRKLARVAPTIATGVRQVTESMNGAGCCAYNDPWGLTDSAGRIDTVEACALITKQIPLILRNQRPDGGFGEVSLSVFRALHTHDLLDELRERPPLPEDWRTVREVPLPEGAWFSLAWDAGGGRLWSFDHLSEEATAFSPRDGSVQARVPIDNCQALAWWDDGLAALGPAPQEIKRIDPTSGEVLQTISLAHMETVLDPELVAGKVVVGDGYLGCVSIIDPAQVAEPRYLCLGGPFPACLAAQGETLWHVDRWARVILRSDLAGRLLDWGGEPFGIQGLAYDGRLLWALDATAPCLRAIEWIPAAP